MATDETYPTTGQEAEDSEAKLNPDNRGTPEHGAAWETVEDAAADVESPFPAKVNGGVRGKGWREWYPSVSVTAESDSHMAGVDLVMSSDIVDYELNLNPDEAVALGELLIEAGIRAEQERSQYHTPRTTFVDGGDNE
jgi:galactitol-specific phosphotransferase system IIB component